MVLATAVVAFAALLAGVGDRIHEPGEGMGQAPVTAALHKGRGVVTGVSVPDGYLELKHDPIPSMKMEGMQMGFSVPDKRLLEGLRQGDAVEFEMRGLPDKDGDYVIEKLRRRTAP